ncbi:MAG: hypothetical protein GXY86_07850 [Firmicutes bacterium]|nr:hypothetical protein [Bacillota bacterium]
MDNKSVKAKQPFLISILLFLTFLFFSIAVYQQAVIERKNSIIRTITTQYTSLRERFIRLTKEK